MSLIFGRQGFRTLAQLADAVIQQITLNQTDYNTLHALVQQATTIAQAKYPNATLFFVTFSDDPNNDESGWVRQICVCYNTAAVTTHWVTAVEFPMRATNGGYYADLSTATVITNVTGSSIGDIIPTGSDGTSGDGTGSSDGGSSDGVTPPTPVLGVRPAWFQGWGSPSQYGEVTKIGSTMYFNVDGTAPWANAATNPIQYAENGSGEADLEIAVINSSTLQLETEQPTSWAITAVSSNITMGNSSVSAPGGNGTSVYSDAEWYLSYLPQDGDNLVMDEVTTLTLTGTYGDNSTIVGTVTLTKVSAFSYPTTSNPGVVGVRPSWQQNWAEGGPEMLPLQLNGTMYDTVDGTAGWQPANNAKVAFTGGTADCYLDLTLINPANNQPESIQPVQWNVMSATVVDPSGSSFTSPNNLSGQSVYAAAAWQLHVDGGNVSDTVFTLTVQGVFADNTQITASINLYYVPYAPTYTYQFAHAGQALEMEVQPLIYNFNEATEFGWLGVNFILEQPNYTSSTSINGVTNYSDATGFMSIANQEMPAGTTPGGNENAPGYNYPGGVGSSSLSPALDFLPAFKASLPTAVPINTDSDIDSLWTNAFGANGPVAVGTQLVNYSGTETTGFSIGNTVTAHAAVDGVFASVTDFINTVSGAFANEDAMWGNCTSAASACGVYSGPNQVIPMPLWATQTYSGSGWTSVASYGNDTVAGVAGWQPTEGGLAGNPAGFVGAIMTPITVLIERVAGPAPTPQYPS
jgi:hypothetical protein